jgi:M6 family metalloprotease-like protein
MSYTTRRILSIVLLAAVLLSLSVVPTTQSAPPAAEAMPPHPRLDKLIQSGALQVPQMVDQVDEGALRMEATAAAPAALTGQIRALAVLVDFSDKVHTVQASYFGSLIFAAPVAGRGSVRDYYNEVTYGQVDIVTLNMPADQPNAAAGDLGWQRAPQTHAYYTNNKYCTDGVYPNNCRKLAEDVVDAINGVVDFSQYDNDHNGAMEPIMIVHAGSGAEYTGSTADIWSHSWYLYNYRSYDGVTISRYVIMPEYWGTTPTANMTIGVFAHEMGHGFWNLPDLYDRDSSSEGIGNWSLMAGGSWNGTYGSSPAWPDAWSRLKMGYSAATTVAADLPGQSIPQVNAGSAGTIFKLKNSVLATQEYVLVENRQKTAGTYDEYLPGAGLAIWHVDEAKASNQNDQECRSEPNSACGATHYEVALEQADGLLGLENHVNRGDDGDIFPGSTAKRTWNNTSDPESGSWYSSTPTNIGVVNISDAAATMTADLLISNGPPPPPAISINDVSVTEGNSGTTNANFAVNLSAASSSAVTVNWATAPGTATADTDYVTASGMVTFAPNVTSQMVTVQVKGDTAFESNETFNVNLANPVGATIGKGTGVGTIVNDDTNMSPVAVISATPTSGYAPLAVSFSGSGSSDSDGSIVSYSWNFGDGTSGTGATAAHTYASAGAYTVLLTVTDDRGGKGTATTAITASQDPARVIRVGDIVLSVVTSSKNKAGKAVIKVTNLSGGPVANATVNAQWSGLVTGTASGKTDATGQVTFTSKSTNKRGTITIKVTGMTPPAGYVYDSTKNLKTSASVTF